MKINEILNEGFWDAAKTAVGGLLTGTQQSMQQNQAANIFRKKFEALVKTQLSMAKQSGRPANITNLIKSYLAQYHWTVDHETETILGEYIKELNANPNQALPKLSALMWQIGNEQVRDAKTGKVIPSGSKPQADQTTTATPPAPAATTTAPAPATTQPVAPTTAPTTTPAAPASTERKEPYLEPEKQPETPGFLKTRLNGGGRTNESAPYRKKRF